MEQYIALRNAVIRQAIDDWVWWEINGSKIKELPRDKSYLVTKRNDARRAWKFLNNEYGNLWLFTDLTSDALIKLAKMKLEMEIEKSKGKA